EAARVLRFDRARRLISAQAGSLAEISAVCGYADQSHLNRDFRRLAETTPGRWLQEDPVARRGTVGREPTAYGSGRSSHLSKPTSAEAGQAGGTMNEEDMNCHVEPHHSEHLAHLQISRRLRRDHIPGGRFRLRSRGEVRELR